MRRLPIALSVVLFICGVASARNVEGVCFEGAEGFSDAQLARALRRYDIVPTPPVDRPTADDAAYFLREFLNREGFWQTRMSSTRSATAATPTSRSPRGRDSSSAA